MNVVRQISGRLEEARKRDIFSPTYSLGSDPLKPSFGLGNRNHHPGRDVVVGLLRNNRKVILSTERNHYCHQCDICQQIG